MQYPFLLWYFKHLLTHKKSRIFSISSIPRIKLYIPIKLILFIIFWLSPIQFNFQHMIWFDCFCLNWCFLIGAFLFKNFPLNQWLHFLLHFLLLFLIITDVLCNLFKALVIFLSRFFEILPSNKNFFAHWSTYFLFIGWFLVKIGEIDFFRSAWIYQYKRDEFIFLSLFDNLLSLKKWAVSIENLFARYPLDYWSITRGVRCIWLRFLSFE